MFTWDSPYPQLGSNNMNLMMMQLMMKLMQVILEILLRVKHKSL
uniref:Uncharacterized protein n=1 Tax=viral metagenome TaxID=1070528 RepID=A0A6C0KAZ0_9ZZZZ